MKRDEAVQYFKIKMPTLSNWKFIYDPGLFVFQES